MHRLLPKWAPLQPVAALELLDAKFADAQIRAYAVSCLEAMPDPELALYVLQLVQVLKYESRHDSALGRFLLRRALLSPHPSWLRSVLLPWAVGDGGRAGGQGGAQAGQAAAEAAAHARAGAASTVSSHGSRRAVCAGSPSPHGLPPPPLGASHPCGPCG